MPKINRDQRRELFLLGQMAKEVGDYFILIKRLEEAKEEYQESVMAYEMISEGFHESDEAQKHKAAVQRILDDLKAGKVPVIEYLPIETAETLKSESYDDTEHLENVVINGIKYVISWLTSVWEPQLAGELPSAADIPEQEHSFPTEQGEITVACYWDREIGNEPAYLNIKWEVNIETEQEVCVRLINPDTQEIRYNINLGTIRVGEEAFTAEELGFDPSKEKWAIVVMLLDHASSD